MAEGVSATRVTGWAVGGRVERASEGGKKAAGVRERWRRVRNGWRQGVSVGVDMGSEGVAWVAAGDRVRAAGVP